LRPPAPAIFVKMIHNGIEYGMMQPMRRVRHPAQARPGRHPAERLTISTSPKSPRFGATGSVVSSWLLDLTAAALAENATLSNFPAWCRIRRGRWTVNAAIEEAVPAEVLTAALYARFRSRQGAHLCGRVLSAMRFKLAAMSSRRPNRTVTVHPGPEELARATTA